MTITSIRLTDAQWSAIECAGILDSDPETLSSGENILRLSLYARQLTVSVTCREAIAEALTELANSEDALAEDTRKTDPATSRLARRACIALTKLQDRVIRLPLTTAPPAED